MENQLLNRNQKIALFVVLTFAIIGLLSSCSINENLEEDCDCTKTTYYYKDLSTEYIQNIDTYILTIEQTPCADDVIKKPVSENIFYNIKCKK